MTVNNLMGFNTIRLLAQTVLRHPYDFEWSKQGLGMLRVYLAPEVRLHVWDRQLLVPGASPLHTHPWDFDSLVVAGRLVNRRFAEVAALAGGEEWNRVVIQCGEQACVVDQQGKVRLVEAPPESYTAGDTYHQDAEEIHWSLPEDGTVTICRRIFHEDRDHARVYWRGRGGWVDARPEKALPGDVKQVCERAIEIWF